MKILFAEDEQDLREVVTAYLEYQGYHVTAVTNGAQAVEKAAADAYDAIVMDIMMPVMDGIAAMRAIRAAGNTVPAIFLTAKSQVADRVEGLDAGADDYLTKPFAMPELMARIRMVTRRGNGELKDDTLRWADLTLNQRTYTLSASSARSVRLGAKEYQMMEYLLRNRARILSREQITLRVWGCESEAEYNNVDVYVSFLRKKMNHLHSAVQITTLRMLGYRLEVLD